MGKYGTCTGERKLPKTVPDEAQIWDKLDKDFILFYFYFILE